MSSARKQGVPPPAMAAGRSSRLSDVTEHLDTDNIGELATKAGVKAVMLYHYDPPDKTDQAAYASGVRKKCRFCLCPDDLDRYCMIGGAVGPCRYRPEQSFRQQENADLRIT